MIFFAFELLCPVLCIQASPLVIYFCLIRLHFIFKSELIFLVPGSFYSFVHLYVYGSGRWRSSRKGIAPVYEEAHS